MFSEAPEVTADYTTEGARDTKRPEWSPRAVPPLAGARPAADSP